VPPTEFDIVNSGNGDYYKIYYDIEMSFEATLSFRHLFKGAYSSPSFLYRCRWLTLPQGRFLVNAGWITGDECPCSDPCKGLFWILQFLQFLKAMRPQEIVAAFARMPYIGKFQQLHAQHCNFYTVNEFFNTFEGPHKLPLVGQPLLRARIAVLGGASIVSLPKNVIGGGWLLTHCTA
jgi:hypothetical protein